MIRRPYRTTSRHRRRVGEVEFLYVLSFAEAVRRRRRPRPSPHCPHLAPQTPRPFHGRRLLLARPTAVSTPARQREDA